MTRALVTGAAGFLGFALASNLADRSGYEVVLADNHVRGERDEAYASLCSRPNVVSFEIDLTDPDQVASLPGAVDYVYHLAALNGTQNFYERPYEVARCCTLPTFYLLDRYGASSDLKRFVYAGSSEAYASTVSAFDWPVPTAEDVPLCIADVHNARWSYGASKLHGEVVVISAMRQLGRPFTIIRYHNAYGPRMGDKHVIPDFLARMKQGVYELYGYEDTRSFIYVDDAVAATIALAEAESGAGEVVNVGSSSEIRILDLARKILELAGVEAEIELHASPKGSVKRRAPDTSKLNRLTHFAERWSLERGLRETMDFYLGSAAGA